MDIQWQDRFVFQHGNTLSHYAHQRNQLAKVQYADQLNL
jgi:hypothetical protein